MVKKGKGGLGQRAANSSSARIQREIFGAIEIPHLILFHTSHMQPISLALSAGSTISSVSHQHKVGFMCVTWPLAPLRDLIKPGPWTVYALRTTRCASQHQSCAFPLQEYVLSLYDIPKCN